MLIAGESARQMDTAAVLRNGRTMVPLRFISEFFAAEVVWDSPSRSVHVFTRGQTPEEQDEIIQQAAAAGAELPRVNSAENLQRLLNEYNQDYNRLRAGDILRKSSVAAQEQAAAPAPAADASSDQVDYSGTNIQVQGVDESDIVKTDGEYLYQVKDDEVIIVKALSQQRIEGDGPDSCERAPPARCTSTTTASSSSKTLRYIVIILCRNPWKAAQKRLMPSIYPPARSETMVTIFDTTDKTRR